MKCSFGPSTSSPYVIWTAVYRVALTSCVQCTAPCRKRPQYIDIRGGGGNIRQKWPINIQPPWNITQLFSGRISMTVEAIKEITGPLWLLIMIKRKGARARKLVCRLALLILLAVNFSNTWFWVIVTCNNCNAPYYKHCNW